VSRADGIAVMKITGSKSGIVNCDLRLKRRIPSDKLRYNYIEGTAKRFSSHIKDVKIAAKDNYLTYEHSFSQAYPGSVQKVEELPQNLMDYIRYVENQVDVPVSIISVGPDRTQTIFRDI